MINLESPSLTSLVMSKLAGSHLRDALRKDHIILETCIARAFMPLLEAVDTTLCNFLQRQGLTLPTFTHQWIACWFAQDVPDAAVASRLLDVFIVSHPLMPIYVAAALLTRQRREIMNSDCHLLTLYSFLRELPVEKLSEEDDRMSHVEEVISTALSYMYVPMIG